jgi:hypothetical protein
MRASLECSPVTGKPLSGMSSERAAKHDYEKHAAMVEQIRVSEV